MQSTMSKFSTIANCSVKESLSRFSKIQLQNNIIQLTSPLFKYTRIGSKNNAIHQFELPTAENIVKEIESCSTDAIATAENLLSCKINPYAPNAIAAEKRVSPIMPRLLKLSDFNSFTSFLDCPCYVETIGVPMPQTNSCRRLVLVQL